MDYLLVMLLAADEWEQITALAQRAAARDPLDNPFHVGLLLDMLWRAGAHEQMTALLARDPSSRDVLALHRAARSQL